MAVDLATFSPKRILVCQLRQIGDVVLATPSIELLKRRYPDAEIHLLTEKNVPRSLSTTRISARYGRWTKRYCPPCPRKSRGTGMWPAPGMIWSWTSSSFRAAGG